MGTKVYHLNIGQPDILTPVEAIEALKNYNEDILKYGASEGIMELRRTVKAYYDEHVAAIDIENIYVTTGASEGILFGLFSCFDPDEEIIIPEPFYANYIGFSKVSGVKLVPVTSRIDDGFKLPDSSEFLSRITSNTKAIFLCNPGNPTGNLYSREELLKIGRIVKEHDLFLIVDEVYREFCYDEDFTSVLSLKGLDDHVMVIDSVSKVFSACGSRIGFIVSRNQELMKTILKYAELRLCPPMIGQYVAEACFVNRKPYLDSVKEEYRQRRDYLYQRLQQISGVVIYLPKAAFYIMTQLPVDDTTRFCRWLLEEFRYDGSTVMLAPGSGFYLSPEYGQNQVRIAFVLGVEDLKKAMDCLQEGLEVYKRTVLNQETSVTSFTYR